VPVDLSWPGERSLVKNGAGQVIGSSLLGQNFARPEYFHPRPSAAGKDGYDGLASGGSYLGPTNPDLTKRIGADIAKFRSENPDFKGPIPADLLTTSGSGLDVSPASAEAQVARVAKARGTTAGRPGTGPGGAKHRGADLWNARGTPRERAPVESGFGSGASSEEVTNSTP
jgi:K+-transporting ATPase KdpC subunit